MRRGLLILTLLIGATAAVAQDTSGLIAMQRRGEILGWEAVGRVDTPKGLCTGVLIAPDVALTAAHCVYDARGQKITPGTIVFRAGYHRGKAMAERRVDQVFSPSGYVHDPSGRISGQAMRHDVALLRLSAPIASSEADPFRIFDGNAKELPVSVVSYGQGREEVLSRQAECSVLRRYSGGQLAFDCNVTFGSSGAPVFVKQDNRIRILSLISAISVPNSEESEAYGMELPDVVRDLMQDMRQDNARPKVTAGARRVVVGQKMQSGARFVRP